MPMFLSACATSSASAASSSPYPRVLCNFTLTGEPPGP
jgi:hypothetical protein